MLHLKNFGPDDAGDAPMTARRFDAQPLYFSSGDFRLFGWLHLPPAATQVPMGLLICKPFGFEAMSAHLSVRAFAETAAQIGIPALRFDYAGTGDSEDLPPEADQLQTWLNDVMAAVDELRRRTGVERVCLLGIRLGAMLAAITASRRCDVSALIAVAPVISGRRYLKEMRTFELAAAQSATRYGAPVEQTPSRDAELAGAGHIEVSGFFLTAKTLAALQQIDLAASPPPAIARALVIDRQDLPGAAAWGQALTAAGVQTRYTALPGFVQMIMRPPNLTEMPLEMIAATREWLSQDVAPSRNATPAEARRAHLAADAAASVMHLRSSGEQNRLTERPVLLREDRLLFGIVTSPCEGEVRRRGVILLNSGGDHHIGPRRLHVSLAREWAKRGYVVMRLDLSGLGDSSEQPGRARNELFPVGAIDDVRLAVEYMRSEHALRDVTLAGMCSGASHALRAGMQGLPINRVLLINPLAFFWEDGLDVAEVQPWEVAHKPKAYLERVFTWAAWRRLLFGDVSIWRVAQIYLARPMMAAQAQMRKLARLLHVRMKNDLRWELEKLKARGVRIVFVFSQADAGLRLLQLQSGLSQRQIAERFCLRIIDGADHEFTRSRPRFALERTLCEELYVRQTGVQPLVARSCNPHAEPCALSVPATSPQKHR